jgi:ATP-dependent 26S proteasome regulatory subunit
MNGHLNILTVVVCFLDGSTNKMLSAFQALNIPVTKTILLHGVSGVGKTTLVKCVHYCCFNSTYLR